MTENNISIWRRFDYLMFGTTIVLVVFGVLMIHSATLGAVDADLINRVPDQIRFGLMGLGLMLFNGRGLSATRRATYVALFARRRVVGISAAVRRGRRCRRSPLAKPRHSDSAPPNSARC